MAKRYEIVQRWWRVTSPEGYSCLERASGPSEAKMRAATMRPGYEPVEKLECELYDPPPQGNWDKLREQCDKIRAAL